MRVIPQGRLFPGYWIRHLQFLNCMVSYPLMQAAAPICVFGLTFSSVGMVFLFSMMIWCILPTRCSSSQTRPLPLGSEVFSKGSGSQATGLPPSPSLIHQPCMIFYPMAVACRVWGRHWKRKRISVLCDNQAVVDIINRGRSSCVVKSCRS